MKKIIYLLPLTLLSASMLKAEEYDDGIAKKAEFRIDLGGATGSYSDEVMPIDLGVGYNINSNFYLGVATGYWVNFGFVDGGNPGSAIPLMADFTYRLNETESDQWTFFTSLRGGMLLGTEGQSTLDDGTEYKYGNYTAFELSPGFMFRMSRNVDLRFSLGYTMALAADDNQDPQLNHNQHFINMRIGFGFRGKPKSGTRREVYLHNLEETNAKQRQELERIRQEEAKKREEAERRSAEERENRRKEREEQSRRAIEQMNGY